VTEAKVLSLSVVLEAGWLPKCTAKSTDQRRKGHVRCGYLCTWLRVYAYSLSKGNQHPFGTGNLRDYRIVNNEETILTIEDFDHYGGQGLLQLIRLMLRSSDKRYTIGNDSKFFLHG